MVMLLIAVISVSRVHWDFNRLFIFSAEILLIFVLSQLLYYKALKYVGYLLSSLLYFVCLINIVSVAVTGDYITYIMWNNLANLQALGPSVKIVAAALVGAFIISFLPTRQGWLFQHQNIYNILSISIVLSYASALTLQESPLLGWFTLYDSAVETQQTLSNFEIDNNQRDNIYSEFEQSSIPGGYDSTLTKPNVIVIFAEGMSKEIFDGNNGSYTDLTPNLDEFTQSAINVTNYYNQTAATYRGLRGQLFSSQQYQEGYENGIPAMKRESNTKLTSIQSILSQNGYSTTMINPEPEQALFVNYLEQLGFDNVISGSKKNLINSGGEKTLPDSFNLQLLLKTAEAENNKGNNFFLSTYTYQTHVGLTSDVKYRDGKNEYLNKYYALDKAFGEFWDNFQKSPLYDNTIVVFTTDHATFPDPDYADTFNVGRSVYLSTVPLLIYYPGGKGQTVDAAGKNSLSLAPTLLDMIGVEDSKNYFLGCSLFSTQTSDMEYLTAIGDELYSTKDYGDGVTTINKKNKSDYSAVLDKLDDFYKISFHY
jgi:phosphoglycerol transferase MdoB-like AlkP superfamily enzyme